jgi:hypothetical protein
MMVPPWREGTEASVLPQGYRDLLEVDADAGRPLRAAEFAVATGLATDKAKVEGLRSKLKLLAARGWLAGVLGACSPLILRKLLDPAAKPLRLSQGSSLPAPEFLDHRADPQPPSPSSPIATRQP